MSITARDLKELGKHGKDDLPLPAHMELPPSIADDKYAKKFVRKLKEFAKHGYAFDAKHSLRKGTRQDPDAKGTQREAFDAYVKGFEEGHRHGYFEIPTGVGKTALFISLAKNFIDAAGDKKNSPRTLIVVPSEKLAVQTAQALAKFMPELAPTIETDDDTGREIDWENSHVGLQYGKVKHADKKPKILITTYQSLNRDRENKIYPPEEYGMVIYDEGHALTAEQYGLAVNKFKNSIQLAVSATPEYSVEKTVAARLSHRYYQLPIADAINRGDLCNVRPVLLKTNYTVDKEKFRQYMEDRQGRPLTDAQLTSLLNEQTRNRAAMETYLLGADPDSGERYLGQNGMIFCGSTDHVDDFARQFNELIKKKKYKPVKEWLHDEAIELIAPIHGKIRGCFLKKGLLTNGGGQPLTKGRIFEGNKEWYTEEEIFELHAKGRILLLASVKKLKEGYDSPRDSIIIDTVDRLSKVDATQIDGRGFRSNPPNKEYNDAGNPDKTCTVVNMVDKNTHELYADKPQMLPIYCAEIIEGAEFRKPTRRKHLIQRFKKEPPELNATLEDSGFKLELDIERVREVSQKNKKARDATEAPSLPPERSDWLSVNDICPQLRVSNALMGVEVEKILQDSLNQNSKFNIAPLGKQAEVVSANEVIGRYKNNRGVTYYCNPIAIAAIGYKLGLKPEDKIHWVNGYDACVMLGLGTSAENQQKISAACQSLLSKSSDSEKGIGTRKLNPKDSIGYFRLPKGKRFDFFFDPVIKDEVLRECGIHPTLPTDKKHWLAPSSFLKAMGMAFTDANIARLTQTLEELLKENTLIDLPKKGAQTKGKASGYLAEQVIGKFRTRIVPTTYYCDPMLVPFMQSRLGIEPLLPDEKSHWLTGGRAICKRFNGLGSPWYEEAVENILQRMYQENRAQYSLPKDDISERGKFSTNEVIGKYRAGNGKAPIYVDPRMIGRYITEDMIREEAVKIRSNTAGKSAVEKVIDGREREQRDGRNRGE